MARPGSLYTYKLQHNLKVASIVLNFILLSVALLVLAGWQFDLVFLRKPFPGLVAMHPLTAVCIALNATGLILLVKRRFPALVKVKAIFILSIGLLEVSGHFGTGINIDHLLFYPKTSQDIVNSQQNVMAPLTAFSFLISGTTMLLLSARLRVRLSQYLTLVILCLSLFSLIGYTYGVSPFYTLFRYYPMAVHTAACFFLLGVSMLFARSSKGFMSAFISPYGGSRLARQLLPVAIFVPVILGLLKLYGEEKKLYDSSFGVALYTVLSIMIFVAFIWKSMASVNSLSFELGEEKAAQQSNQIGNLIMNAALEAIICINKEGIITLWNPRAQMIFGWSKEEVMGKRMAEIIIPPHLRKHHEAGMQKYLQTGEWNLRNNVIITTALDKQGRELQIELAITRLNQGDNEIFCGFIRDITERLKHLRDIEQQNEKLRDIAWTQSHIVRAPVANILGLLELLSDPRIDESTSQQLLELLKSSVQQLDQVIRDIVSRAEEIQNPPS